MSGGAERPFEFEAAVQEVEEIVARLDREGVDLDEAIGLFERGIKRLGEARKWLETASGKVEELIATSTGKLDTTPLGKDPPGKDAEAGDSGSAA